MNALKRRIDRLERISKAGQEEKILVCTQEADQSQAQAMAAAGIKINPEDEDKTIIIFVRKFHYKEPVVKKTVTKPIPTKLEDIDKDIIRLEEELINSGLSRQEIAELLADDTPIKTDKEHSPGKDSLLDIKPVKSSDLGKMFR